MSESKKSYISPWMAAIFRPIHAVFMALYFRVTVRGLEHLPDEGPVILAPTHRTRWDTFMLYCAVKRRHLRFLTSRNEAEEGIQGWFASRLGAFPIDTRRPAPGALKHCREILMDGQILVIFPEGNIFRIAPGSVHPIKPGAAWLAGKVQKEMGGHPLKIVPVRLNFADRFLKFRSRAEVAIGEPLIVSDYFDGRPDKQAVRALTADLQAALGDTVDGRPPEATNARGPQPGPGEAGAAFALDRPGSI